MTQSRLYLLFTSFLLRCPAVASPDKADSLLANRCHSLRSLDPATGGAPIAPPMGEVAAQTGCRRGNVGTGILDCPKTFLTSMGKNVSFRTGLGYGWRTNYNQRVYVWEKDTDFYIWEDEDGTDHYFEKQSDGTFKDEDGLELTLTDTGTGNEKYIIQDKNGNKTYFDGVAQGTVLCVDNSALIW